MFDVYHKVSSLIKKSSEEHAVMFAKMLCLMALGCIVFSCKLLCTDNSPKPRLKGTGSFSCYFVALLKLLKRQTRKQLFEGYVYWIRNTL